MGYLVLLGIEDNYVIWYRIGFLNKGIECFNSFEGFLIF